MSNFLVRLWLRVHLGFGIVVTGYGCLVVAYPFRPFTLVGYGVDGWGWVLVVCLFPGSDVP